MGEECLGVKVAHWYLDLLEEGGCPSNVKNLMSAQTGIGHTVLGFGFESESASPLSRELAVITAPRSIRGLRYLAKRMVDEEKVDVVTVWSPLMVGNEYTMRRAGRAGLPVILSLQGHLEPFLYASGRALRKRIYRRISIAPALRRWVTDVHAQSPYEASLAEGLGFKGRVHVFPLGTPSNVPPSRRPGPLRMALNLSAEEVLVGFFGRFDPVQKRFDALLAGISRARHVWEADKARFVIAGRGSEKDRAVTSELIQKYELGNVVDVVGPFDGDDRFHALADLDVLLHPSRYEGLPRVIREAAAVGTPAIITRQTNAELLVQAGGAALVDPDPDSIARAIVRSVEDREWRSAASRAARAWAVANDWPACARRFDDVYRGALDPSSP
jgi:glycosyltransferase involved in cell wall biosynthesis